MNGSRLSDDDRDRIRARFAAGETVGTVARALGRNRQTVSRVKEDLERQDGTRLAVKLNFRVTEAEHAHLLAAIRSSDLTVSEAIRHLVRQATSLLALQSPEIEAIAAARRDLAAVGNNLNQLARWVNANKPTSAIECSAALIALGRELEAIRDSQNP